MIKMLPEHLQKALLFFLLILILKGDKLLKRGKNEERTNRCW
jgi:hypothetical protein